ncbi:MAG: SGNH hydrolase domain-containing protein, partial [Thiotrichaceae bacterium]
QTFRYLGIKKKQKVVVIGNKFFGNMSIRNYIHMPDNELRSLRVDVGTASSDINSILKKKLNHRVTFVDPHKLVCGNSTTCPVFTNNLRLISYDGRHLTKAGARYIGKILFQRSALGQI